MARKQAREAQLRMAELEDEKERADEMRKAELFQSRRQKVIENNKARVESRSKSRSPDRKRAGAGAFEDDEVEEVEMQSAHEKTSSM
mmetsp:Transcript_29428/g.44550  ORF Transcript_29428/g.44550 Transcript_29428/m.44550 type:complete len:87 (-) Transcript_29428:49-309(-)